MAVLIDSEASPAGWSVEVEDERATIRLARDLDADDAFPLRVAVGELVEQGCTEFVFDVQDARYISHSAQAVIRDIRKGHRQVALRGISERLRRVLVTDRVKLLATVDEQLAT